MPLHQLECINTNYAYLVWHIRETEEELFKKLSPAPLEVERYRSFQNSTKRLEWLATRLAYQVLCQHTNLTYTAFLKEANKRPYLSADKGYISLSHCFPFAVATISQNTPIGVDIQVPSSKLHSIQKKYLHITELEDANQDLEKLCIYWCAKEAIYKAHGQQCLSLQAIHLLPFVKNNHGIIQALISSKHLYSIHYYIRPSYILVICQPDRAY